MSVKCVTCGSDVEIVGGNSTFHYKPIYTLADVNIIKHELEMSNSLLKEKTEYCIELEQKIDFLIQELSVKNS